jgi:2-amino-4-hydroxy-6-hydroxymethyldihydropteridine diphosphokinase
MALTYLLLGSNLGDSLKTLEKAVRMLGNAAGNPVAISPVYETEPWGNVSGGNFYNCVIELETTQSPAHLMKLLLDIERQLGRTRTQDQPEPRTIDIDLLLWEDSIIEEPGLQVPHPRMHLRNFVLAPMVDLAADVMHPVFNKSMKQLLDECTDRSKVKKVSEIKII